MPGPGAILRAPAHPAPASPLTTNTCTGWNYQLVPPPTIRVYRHATGASEQYDFVFYVTHVLPSEWVPSWDADALGAGAVAARTYAAYRAMSGHAYSGGTNCADARDDSQDQVFDPTYSTAATDQAVYATFGSILYRSGGLFLSQYFGGAPGDPCALVTGQYAGRMDQWGTQTCGMQGVLWPAVTTTFYAGTTWNYLQNLLLNPSVSSPGMYPWQGDAAATFSRVSGSGYDGGWYLTMSSTKSGTPATVFQQRAFDGTASTAYHAQVALRCPATNAKNCNVTVEVVAVPASGDEVARAIQITVKRDGLWYLVGFDPPASGSAHGEVRFAIVTKKPVDVDAALLTSTFGG